MFGYDLPRLHAALNDLPAALLVASVLFDLIGAAAKRDTLKAAGFWCLVLGAAGAGLAVATGLLAEDAIEHTDAAHAVMETHETIAFIVLGMFGVLAAWRIVRRGAWGPREQPIALTAGVIGLVLMTITGKLGGNLVFDHGAGISTEQLRAIAGDRGDHDADGHSHGPAAPADTTAPRTAADSARAAHDSVPHDH